MANRVTLQADHAIAYIMCGTPHSMHWHINKQSFKGWGLNFIYFGLHAAQIYLIIKLT